MSTSSTGKPKTRRKTTARKAPAAAATAKAAAPTAEKPQPGIPAMRKRELVDTVVERTGMKKKDVKPVIEAALTVLGEAIASDKDLNLPPFGKLKVKNTKDLEKARVTAIRLRQPKTLG